MDHLHTQTQSSASLEHEFIEFFVHLAGMLSLPKSVGEIYGLLYATPAAIPFEEIQNRLKISKGSVSQGLRFLRSLGAVQVRYVSGDRRDHYQAETSLRRLAEGFLRDRIQPHLDSGQQRLQTMEQLLDPTDPHHEHYQSALNSLKSWSNRARLLMPLVKRVVKS
jgi:DNA-binding transcriptional regulator GbsR (MarR family)